MILYKQDQMSDKRKRKIKNINLSIEEKPERPVYIFTNSRARVKFIMKCENIIRRSQEYKEYMIFLKNHMDMRRCTVLKGLNTDNGKRYSIEIHHGPFKLIEIVDTIINKREALGESLNPFYIAEEVVQLHYDEKVGLIPLSITMHELVTNDKIFIPLQYYYQQYDKFYEEYEEYIYEGTKEKIKMFIDMSMKCDSIQSDVLEPEFVYVNIDGFNFPEIPEEWGNLIQKVDIENIQYDTN